MPLKISDIWAFTMGSIGFFIEVRLAVSFPKVSVRKSID